MVTPLTQTASEQDNAKPNMICLIGGALSPSFCSITICQELPDLVGQKINIDPNCVLRCYRGGPHCPTSS